jgi:hypothetical protein
MDGMSVFDGFQLHDDAIIDQQIQFERAADAVAFLVNGNVPLADSHVPPRRMNRASAFFEGFRA